MAYVAKVWNLVLKDLAIEMRSREMLTPMVVFALIVIMVFSFSFELRVASIVDIAPGLLWVTITFAGMLGLGRSFIQESDQGCLDGLLLCPVDRTVIYFGKMLSNLLFMSLIEIIILPLFVVFFDLDFYLALLPVIFLGTLGFAAVGSLFSAMSVQARAREVMLPILLFPVVIPALIAAVKITAGILDDQPWSQWSHWFQLLVGFDVIFVTISYMTFDYVIEE
jgi:heme exporter protein B